jgi:phosphoribosylanthranilate isomerase
MTWVKICGITNLKDARTAVDAGADALGFVFYEKSPRYVDPETVHKITPELPSNIEKIGVFVNRSAEEISVIALNSQITAIQVCVDVAPSQGDAECAYCFEQLVKREPPLKLIPVLSMCRERPEGPAMMWSPDAVHAFLLDSSSSGQPGGTGEPFNWAASEGAVKVIKSLANVVVAGGLTVTNVTEAMRILKPWGVDVSSGVEAHPGKKDPEKVRAFIAAVRDADRKAQ